MLIAKRGLVAKRQQNWREDCEKNPNIRVILDFKKKNK